MLTETMLLTWKRNVGCGNTLGLQSCKHHLSLIGWNDFILKPLEEDHRTGETIYKV